MTRADVTVAFGVAFGVVFGVAFGAIVWRSSASRAGARSPSDQGQ
jgi:hypothetical protein